MLRKILSQSFGLLRKIEENPTLDILVFQVNNDPTSLIGLDDISGYSLRQKDVPYIYSDGPDIGQSDDDTSRSNLTIFIRDVDLTIEINYKLIFRIDDRLYKLVDKDPNSIFGLWEFNLSRSD